MLTNLLDLLYFKQKGARIGRLSFSTCLLAYNDIVFVCAIGRAIGARSCAVKFRKHARIDVLATHVHLILSTQPGYLNTYYVNMSAQVNYQRIVRIPLSFAKQMN